MEDKLLSYRCEGTTKIGVFVDSNGVECSEIIETNCRSCGAWPEMDAIVADLSPSEKKVIKEVLLDANH